MFRRQNSRGTRRRWARCFRRGGRRLRAWRRLCRCCCRGSGWLRAWGGFSRLVVRHSSKTSRYRTGPKKEGGTLGRRRVKGRVPYLYLYANKVDGGADHETVGHKWVDPLRDRRWPAPGSASVVDRGRFANKGKDQYAGLHFIRSTSVSISRFFSSGPGHKPQIINDK